jgi:hypothetical protein
MKTAIALITAALTATSAQAWGEREQGALAGIVGTIVLQQIYKDSEQRQEHPPVIIRDRQPPQPVIVYRQPPAVIIQDTPHIMCPQGTAEFYVMRYDRHGRPFYLFDGCR